MQKVDRIIMWRLLKGDAVTYKAMVDHLYSHKENGGPLDAKGVIDVRISYLRRTCPVKIHTVWGVGLRVERCDLPVLHDWLVAELINKLYGAPPYDPYDTSQRLQDV